MLFREIFKANKWVVLIYLSLLLISTSIGILPPLFLAKTVNAVFLKDKEAFFFFALSWIFLTITNRGVGFSNELLASRLKYQLTLNLRSVVISRIALEEREKFFVKNTSQYLFWLTEETNRIINVLFNVFNLVKFIFAFLIKIIIITTFHFYFSLITIFFFFLFLFYMVFWHKKLKKWSKEESEIGNMKTNYFRNFTTAGEVMLLENKMNVFEKMIIKLRRQFFFLFNRIIIKREFIHIVVMILMMSVNSFIIILSGYFAFNNLISLSAFFIMNYYVIWALWDSNNITGELSKILGERYLLKKYSIVFQRKVEQETPSPKFFNLSLEKITFSFEDKVIIDNFSLEIQKGEKILITGPSGRGKSTLSLIIAGVLKPQEGSVKLNQQTPGYEKEGLSKLVNFVSKSCSIFDATFCENLYFFQQQRAPQCKQQNNVLQLLEIEEIELNRQITRENLSYGEVQRVMLARELMDKKEIVILDEALSNVDARLRDKIENFLLEDQTITLVHITHNIKNKNKYDKVISLT